MADGTRRRGRATTSRGRTSGPRSSTTGSCWPTDVDGVYGRSATYESVADAIDRLVLRVRRRPGGAERAVPAGHAVVELREERVPRVVSRPDGLGPHLPRRRAGPRRAGARGRGGRGPGRRSSSRPTWSCARRCATPCTRPSPARCPRVGRGVEVYGYCFRHEPSTDPFRMQAFRQHDYVYLGTPDGARAHRDRWIERGLDVLERARARGRVGGGQRPVLRPARPDAGRQPAIGGAQVRDRGTGRSLEGARRRSRRPTATSTTSGGPSGSTPPTARSAHTACFGFGVDRITLALLDRHGTDPAGWPAGVRAVLWPWAGRRRDRATR